MNFFPFWLEANGGLEQESVSAVADAVLVVELIRSLHDRAGVNPIIETQTPTTLVKAHGSLVLVDHIIAHDRFKVGHDFVQYRGRPVGQLDIAAVAIVAEVRY